jgi:hypothetical protein
VAEGVPGAVVTVVGGGAAFGCALAATATPADGRFELVPLELHCMAVWSWVVASWRCYGIQFNLWMSQIADKIEGLRARYDGGGCHLLSVAV